jgi:ornithine decarboxylase
MYPGISMQNQNLRETSDAMIGMPGQPDCSAPTALMDEFILEKRPLTPYVILDLNVVRARHEALRQLLPAAKIYYAIKANPATEVISALARLDTNFDLASSGEINLCLGLNVPSERLSFGNTIKRESAIAKAWSDGISLFAFDSIAELEKLARSAPGARVFCRILIENKGAEWPLTRKFGCESHMAVDLLAAAKRLGLRPVGLSFHVGSQQTDPNQWKTAIGHAAWVFRACAQHGIALELLNLGGGLPAHYREPVPPLAAYAEAIEEGLRRSLAPRGQTSWWSRAVTWLAMPACYAPRYCSFRANQTMSRSAGYTSMPASTTVWTKR